RRSVQGIGGDHRLAPVGQGGDDGHLQRSHPGGAGQGAMSALQNGYQLLKSDRGRILVARIAIARFLLPEDTVELLHGLVEVTGGGVDGGGDGNVRAGFLAVARVNRLRVNLQGYFLFQRTPALVSSRIMPSARSCSRIWSARAKFLAFLAAARS